MIKRKVLLTVLAIFLVTFAFLAGAFLFSSPPAEIEISRPTDFSAVAPGCTLFAPSQGFANKENHKAIFLINNRHEIVHSWATNYSVDVARLGRNANLWVATVDSNNLAADEITTLRRLSWQGELLSEYPIAGMTHDFDLNADETAFATEIELILPAEKLPSAFRDAKVVVIDRPWHTQNLIEVDTKSGKTTRTLDLLKIFPLATPNALQLETREIFHVNSIRYLAKNPVNGRPAFLISIRNLSIIAMLDQETGEMIWEYRPPSFQIMHDAQILSNGDLLIFNNDGASNTGSSSSIQQIDIKTKEVVWLYRSMRRKNFNNSSQGAVQRLENKNTLITNSQSGHVFEVTPNREVVWEFFNTSILNTKAHGWPFASIFRATKYSERDVDWKKLGVDCR